MIYYAFFLAYMVMLAVSEWGIDYRTIKLGIEVDHAKGLARRVRLGAIGWVIMAFAACLSTLTVYWSALLWIPAGWALWTMLFRFLLNKSRGNDWRYVSPSNWYDWQFLKRIWFTVDGHSTTRKHAIVYHGRVYGSGPFYTKAVHRAGLYAYIFEGLVFVIADICLFRLVWS